MTETVKLYVETGQNLIDSDSAAATAAVLTGLTDDQDSITFTGDEHGHYFAIPVELLDAFRKAVGSDEDEEEVEAPKKRGRPKKAAAPKAEEPEVAEEVAPEDKIVLKTEELEQE